MLGDHRLRGAEVNHDSSAFDRTFLCLVDDVEDLVFDELLALQKGVTETFDDVAVALEETGYLCFVFIEDLLDCLSCPVISKHLGGQVAAGSYSL